MAREMTGVAVGRENFQSGALGRSGQRVRVLAHVNRAGDVLTAAIVANGLGDGENVRFSERSAQR
jgi:hypothetical protein